jgi:hypothetical protein
MSPKVMVFVLFHLSGHPRHPSLVLSLMVKRGTTSGSLKEVTYHSRSYLPLSILDPSILPSLG